MPLQKFDVLVADLDHPDDPDHASTHRVTVLHCDRLAAEQNANANGVADLSSIAGTSLILWNGLRRTGVHNLPYQEFLPRILDFDVVEEPPTGAPDAGDHLEGLADPTPPAPSGSPSPSDSTGPGLTGSTPPPAFPGSTPTG